MSIRRPLCFRNGLHWEDSSEGGFQGRRNLGSSTKWGKGEVSWGIWVTLKPGYGLGEKIATLLSGSLILPNADCMDPNQVSALVGWDLF